MTATIPTIVLRNGMAMPIMAFGTGTAWYKDDRLGPFDPALKEVLKSAIKQGYRHFDCAEAYGTEEELGQAIQESDILRQELFINTKVLETIDDIPRAIDTSLHKLGLEYVDLYLIHSPYFARNKNELQDAWRRMEYVQRSGKAKAIGVSSFLRNHVEAILEAASVPPVVNQIEFHPYLQPANGYVPWLLQQGIQVQSFFGLAPITLARDGPLRPILERIAAEHSVEEAAILFRWQLDQNVVSITTTRRTQRIPAYLQALETHLSSGEMDEITCTGSKYHFRARLNEHFTSTDRS